MKKQKFWVACSRSEYWKKIVTTNKMQRSGKRIRRGGRRRETITSLKWMLKLVVGFWMGDLNMGLSARVKTLCADILPGPYL